MPSLSHASSLRAAEPSALLGGLDFLWLEITGKCNLNCSHCYADSSPLGDLLGAMRYDDWCAVIDQAAALGCRQLQFIGGEPTLHPHLSDLIDHANHRHFELIEVFTNATRLDDGLIGCFQRNHVQLATSFYSVDAAVHEQVTQGKGSWQRTVGGIRSALAADLPLRVGVIETDANPGHGPEAIAFLQQLGVQQVGFDQERGVGRGTATAEPQLQLQSELEGERFEQLCGQCWKGKLCVTPSGEAFPCVFSRATRLGDVRQGLSAILQSRRLQGFRQRVQELEQQRLAEHDANEPQACVPGSCSPGTYCSPYSCYPASGPCSPACSPVNCTPGTGPCYPAG
ncbi:MAG: radical SAM protein [Synechococcus sp.]